MSRKIIFLLFGIIIFSCKNMQNYNSEFIDINKYMVYFNYTTKEICLLDIDTGYIGKRFKINFDIQQYTINKFGYVYKWYKNGANIYLMERYVNRNDIKNSNTKIYKIDMENLKLTEIFYSEKRFYNFCIEDNYLYLMSYVEPSNDKLNKELNYITLHNLLDGNETIINFNELLLEDEQICSPDFLVNENRIIMTGWIDIIQLKKLYKYDLEAKTIDVIDDKVTLFSIFNDTILYIRNNVNVVFADDFVTTVDYKGICLVTYDLKNNIITELPYQVNTGYLDFSIVDDNIMIYTDERKTVKSFFNKFWIFPSRERNKNYWISNINRNNRKLFFSSRDEIGILGIMDK